MDSIDWLFAESNPDDCQIVEADVEIIDISSSTESCLKNNKENTLSIKIEKNYDTIYHRSDNCHSPPLFESEDAFSTQVEEGDLILNLSAESVNLRIQSPTANADCYQEPNDSFYEIDFLEAEEMHETTDVNNNEDIGFEDRGTQLAVPNDSRDINEIDTSLTKLGNNRQRKKFVLSKSERVKHSKANRRNHHQLKPPCSSNCKKLCSVKITNECRQKINDMFWTMNWCEQGNFVKDMTSKSSVSRKTVNSNKRQYTITYTLHNDQEETQNVCQTFFLATLGFNKNNNTILKRIQCEKNTTTVEKRGKYFRGLGYQEMIKKHIESFNPTISHYRREHSPNKRYLPSDVTIKIMYDSFHEINPTIKCSYDTYRKVVKEQNISFTILGNEECERCATYNIIKMEHENCDTQCNTCADYNFHNTRYTKSRESYEQCKNIPWDENEICLSVDLQKVIMLPRMDMFKQILFTRRIMAFNESFVPVGKWNQNKKPMAVIWHQATTGRKKEDLISAFYKCILYYRDMKKIKFWLDNCSSQNKNWALFSFFVTLVNSPNINAEEFELWYFEPGHTFMSADSFHHQVELSLKRQRKTYDFNDFQEAVKKANKGNCIVEVMTEQNLYFWEDNSSLTRIKKSIHRPYLKNMVKIKFKRNSKNLFYSYEYDNDDYTELPFLKASVEKNGLVLPEKSNQATGISTKHHQQIIKEILPLLPKNRHHFWTNLNVTENLTEDDSVLA